MCVVSRSTAIASPATPLKTLPPTTILVFPMSQNFLGWLPSSRFLRRCVRRGEKKKTIKGRFGETALPFSFPPPSFIHPIFSPFAFYFPPSFPSLSPVSRYRSPFTSISSFVPPIKYKECPRSKGIWKTFAVLEVFPPRAAQNF